MEREVSWMDRVSKSLLRFASVVLVCALVGGGVGYLFFDHLVVGTVFGALIGLCAFVGMPRALRVSGLDRTSTDSACVGMRLDEDEGR